MKKILILITTVVFVTMSSAQTSLNGPEGCDATYFFAAKNGYWLGTGSSGGIFFNTELNAKWKCMNNPFGPAHIYWIGLVEDKIITNADGKYYEFENKNLVWNLVSNTDKIAEYNSEESATKKNELNSLKEIFKNNRVLNLPYDVNTLHPYNSDSVIVCTQSGLYLLNVVTSKLHRINTVGVVASDVYQINKTEELGLIALTQDNCIWSYKNFQWAKLFDYKETAHYKEKFIIPISLDNAINNDVKIAKVSSFYPKGIFSVCKNGMIILTSFNSIFIINPSNKQYEIINPPTNHNILEAKLELDGKVVAAGDFSYDANNKFMYKKFSLNERKWNIESSIIENKSLLPVLDNNLNTNDITLKQVLYKEGYNTTSNSYSFLYPMISPQVKLLNKTLFFTKLKNVNYAGYYYQNKINSKIISGYYDSSLNELYLGTYGSGVIMIK